MYHIADLNSKTRLLFADSRRRIKCQIIAIPKHHLLTDIPRGIHIRKIVRRDIERVLAALQT